MKTKTILKLGGFALLAYGSWNLGFWFAHPNPLRNPAEAIPTSSTPSNEATQQSATVQSSQQTSALFSKIANEKAKGAPTSSDSATTPMSYASIISAHHLEKKDRELSPVFSPSPVGQTLLHVSTLLDFAPIVRTEEGKLVAQQIQMLRSQPDSALAELVQSVPKMSSEYSHERQFLVQLALQLNVDPKAKVEFFTSELQRSSAPFNPEDQTSYNGVVALSALLQATTDTDNIESSLRQTFAIQQDPTIRMMLISTYATKFPSQAQKLKEEFNR